MNPLRNFTTMNLPGLRALRRASNREFCSSIAPNRHPNREISKRDSTRRYNIAATVERDLEKYKVEMMELCKVVSPSMVVLLSYFSGPLISIKLAVVSSPEIAKELFKTQDRTFCSRPPKSSLRILHHQQG